MQGTETIAQALASARKKLTALDARLLLQHVLGLDHAELIAAGDRRLSSDERQRFAACVARRMAHEPVSKILGWNEFYGRRFIVSQHVLDPRPDTETLIELAKDLVKIPAPRVLDLGTGSGAILLTLLAEWPQAIGMAVDISPEALEVARQNAPALNVAARCDFSHGAWFEAVSGRFDLIVSNPPYIPAGDIAALEPDVREHDPLLALDGGADGLTAYRAIAAGASPYLNTDGLLILEIGAGQRVDVEAIFASHGFTLIEARRDLGGHERALAFTRRQSPAAMP
ncbi:MAG: peptide chain release factor N(5)-glutamine methyltransferase [Hyphomicrobiales bacterium]